MLFLAKSKFGMMMYLYVFVFHFYKIPITILHRKVVVVQVGKRIKTTAGQQYRPD